MRKIICALIIVGTILTTSPASAKSKKAPKKLSPALYAALEKRINEATDVNRREFLKEKPDLEVILKYVSPKYKSRYQAAYEKEVATRNAYETRSSPVDVRRIISITQSTNSSVWVDLCYVTSIRSSSTPLTVDSGEALVGSRDQEQWILIKNVWFKGAQKIGPLLVNESQCLDAQ